MKVVDCELEGKESVEITDRQGNRYDLSRLNPRKISVFRGLLHCCGVTEMQAALQENEYATPPAESVCATCKAKLICRKRPITDTI